MNNFVHVKYKTVAPNLRNADIFMRFSFLFFFEKGHTMSLLQMPQFGSSQKKQNKDTKHHFVLYSIHT